MENLTIYKNEQELFESERDFKSIQSKVNEFLTEAQKCKLQINSITDLTGLISNTRAEARQQYLNQIKDSDIPGTENFKQTREEFIKTLQLPDLSKLLQLSAFLHPRVSRISLGTLSGNKLCWDQKKFDKYSDGFIVKSDTELSKHIMKIAESVEEFKNYLQDLAIKQKQDITLLSNLLPSVGRLLVESGKKIYINTSAYNQLTESIK